MNGNSPSRETLIASFKKPNQSSFKKYKELFVGSQSIIDLLLYDFITTFISPISGSLGFFLRKHLYKLLIAELGANSVYGSHMTLRCPKNMRLGDNNIIDDYVVLDAKGSDSCIELGNSVLVGRYTILSCTSASIEIQNDVSIGPNCHIRAGLCQIKIGSHVTIGSHSVIISGSPGYKRLDIPMKSQVGSTEGIEIGDDVWIGVGVKVIDDVTIGKGSVIGAGAVVTENIQDYAIAAGVPAKVIGYRNESN